MDWVNENMVDVIDRLNRIVALFAPTVFSKREEKRERTNDDNVNATSRKVNDAYLVVVSINARVLFTVSLRISL